MKPVLDGYNVRTRCPDCGGSITTFEFRSAVGEWPTILIDRPHQYQGINYPRIMYRLLRCASCGRAGLAKIHDLGNSKAANVLEDFYPKSVDLATIPAVVPAGIQAEYREAEICASVGAWRAASALLRSTLEKTLKANGYTSGNLAQKINQAADDGVITESRRKRAHDNIRVLGNDILHDEWREITEEEYIDAHNYTQRILEDFYDDRASVEAILIEKKRIEKAEET